MFKSKIFNSVMRYMLVAMLALLPNAIWAIPEQTFMSLASGNTATISGFNQYLTTNDYSAWYVYDADGGLVDISSWNASDTYHFTSFSKEKDYWKVGKPYGVEPNRSVKITTAGEDISNYKIVLLVSSSDAFFNAPSEATAEKKITFKLISENDAPLLKDYTGTNKMSVTDFVADGSTSYSFDLASSLESLLSLSSTSDGSSFDTSSKKIYLRINLRNKTTNANLNASEYKIEKTINEWKVYSEINNTSLSNNSCKNDKGTFYYSDQLTSANKKHFGYKITLQNAADVMSKYAIDVYLSDETADVINYNYNTLLLQEPTLKAMITYNLLSQSEKDNLTFDATDDSSLGASKVFDFRQAFTSKTAKVQLLTEENKQRLCNALGVTDLSKVTDLYVRWMITDKSGNAIAGITASGLTLRKDKKTEKEIYYTWFSENAASTLSAALNPTFTFPSTMSWDDLKVSCVVSNTKLKEDTNVKYGVMIKEPDAFNIKFNVSLEEAPLLNDLDAAYSTYFKTKTQYLKESTIKSKQLIITDIATLIEDFSLYTKDASGNYVASSTTPVYYRVSIIDKTTNKPISSISYHTVDAKGAISGGVSTSFYSDYKYNNSKGLFYYSKDKTSVPKSDLYIAFGFNSETDFLNSRIEVYFSDEAPVLDNYLVVTEPTIKGKLVYDIKSATDAPFKHYKGYVNADYEEIDASKGQLRQKTYTWEYTYPVEVGKPVALTLPLEKYATEGNPLEPLGYFRWYNYDTDMASENLKADDTTGGSITRYQHELKDEEGNCKGIFAYNLPINTNAWQGNVGVDYTRPGDASWEGETIACDVSRYVDGIDATGSYMEHESTLSVRYIFHLIPAKQMADMEKDYLTHSDNDLTYEDNKNVTVGFANAMSTMTLRLNMKPTMYYFYPMTNPKHHVYFPTGQTDRDIVETDFGLDLKQATKVIWRIYNGDKDKYCDFKSNVDKFPRFFDVSQNLLNSTSNTWKDLDGNSVTGNITFNYGDHFSVVAYAVADDDSSCPIANFNCRFFGFHPMMDSEMGIKDVQRKISYLEENYNRVALISFDNDSPEQTVSAPTNDMDNQSEHPSDWSKRNYGFVYKNLMSKSATHTGSVSYYDPMHSPLHGEYGIYKTANVTGVSTNSDKYLWHHTGTELHDRTRELTGGSQTGSFLYVDASDESRTIASAEFNANLCTGQQMAFSAYVADMTDRETKPQLMFKLYGLVGNQKVLLHNFSSGDFGTNRDTQNKGEWYQVYGKITIQKEAHAELYDNFRIEIDNYSQGTQGADYAVDDIRIYSKPAKIEVYQDRPACGSSTTGNIKLKVRAIHETLNALLGHKNTTIHFRFVNEDGSPVTGEDLYDYTLDGVKKEMPDSYASVDVYNSEADCNSHIIDGVNMIETDADGERYIILANHKFALTKGKKYYVSVCTDSNPDAADAKWGKPSDVCSIYSDLFELIGQTPAITDADGNIITEYRVNCTDPDPKVTLKGSLTTINPKTGAKITLTDVPFFWYIDQATTPYKSNALNEITIPISSEFDYGAHTVYMKPEPTRKNADGEEVYTTPDGVSYLLCNEAIPVTLRIAKDGPQLNFGFNDVYYPFNDATYKSALRIGLPQIKKLLKQNETNSSEGYLQVPLHSASYKTGVEDKTLTFIDDSKTEADNTSTDVYVATTNDPLWDASLLNKPVATLKSDHIGEVGTVTQATLDLLFSHDVLDKFHEGYYYELRFVFEQGTASAGTTSCPGEAYLKLKIVPEFITWTPTADGGMNANWNNDANWHRSSSAELYDDGYTDYLAYGKSVSGTPTSAQEIPTLNSYVPMKFTKVTIDNLKGLPFPDLGNVVYRKTNKIATKLTNGKGNEATKYIQYDIMAIWNEADVNKGFETDGNLKCEKFYGNTCHQIYFKPQGELRDQCYLVYDKAWVEKELEPNKWYTMASPLQYIYAGDMYVPASNGRQETKAFTDITFDTNTYSRSKYPVYQRAWMKSDVKEITPDSEPDYDAWHKPAGAPSTVDMNLGYWSHVYNKVDESYSADGTFGGFSIKAGNALLPKDQTTNALLRLPKADNEYQYFDYNGNENSSSKTRVAKDAGHGKLLVAFNNDEKHLAEKFQTLGDNASGFYLVANPYTCSISMAKFFEANTGLQNAIWIVENGEVKAISSTELGKQNYAILPTQSFFVKKNASATIREVRFTSTMCVDRTITPGLLMASDYVKTVEVETGNSNGQTSKARIALRQEASADYDDEEDVDLLYDQNLKDIPQVYTVAGNEAVAVNAVPELSWIPLGIVSQQAEEVSLTLKGVNKLDAPVYLYDAASASYTELHEGEAVKVKAGDHGRYFLTQTRTVTSIDRIEAEEQNAPVKVYSPAAGMIVVSALGGEKLDKVQVFTLDGKKVHSYQLPDKQRMILRVPSGVYIVKASTQSCAQAKGQKVAVR